MTFSYYTIESVTDRCHRRSFLEEFTQDSNWIFENISDSGNTTQTLDHSFSTSPTSYSFRGGEFMLEEIEGHLADNSFLPGIDDADYDLGRPSPP
ncbi:hypothetical protein Tco_0200249 [Tanacetum coccineum]